MIHVRKASDRGLTQIDWLKSFHTFSFGQYYDPLQMGFDHLRVINEDTVQPSKGFGMHEHQNMEIITYVVDGALEHKDSLGTGSVIRPGEIQRMSAGTGVRHSEYNHSKNELVHFLQIWIIPNKAEIPPSYEQKSIPNNKKNELILIGSPEGGSATVTIHQNVDLYAAFMTKGASLNYDLQGKGWLQVIKGKLEVNDTALASGDGASINNEKQLQIKCLDDAEFLLFDLKSRLH